jgi:thiamine-monophosphate kinase
MFKSEKQFVCWLQSHMPSHREGLRLGIGDDAALVAPSPGHEVILTTDLSVEGIHFRTALHPPQSVGHRALARALSDIAAMGGKPKFALVSMALSHQTLSVWVMDFYRGLFRLASQHGTSVIGGDTTVHRGRTLVDIVAFGEVQRGRALLRSGAKVGDVIFTGGRLGCSALGFKMLATSQKRGPKTTRAPMVQAHLFPQPQCRLGETLASLGFATSAMDLSDGLSMDLERLCEASGVGARIHLSLLPLPFSPSFGLTKRTLERLALDGGEDYKLLFTVSPKRSQHIPRKIGGEEVFRIGEITKGRGVVLVREDGRITKLKGQGYDHFRLRGSMD